MHRLRRDQDLFLTFKAAAKLLAGTAAASLVLSGCSPSGAGQSSTVKHDYDKPVRDTSAWNWRSATDDDYANIMAPLLGLNAASILPTNSPITQRAQLWLDRVDAYVRGTHADAFAHVPKPQAKVLNNAAPNAFVAPIPACYSVPVQLAKTTASANSVDAIFVDVKTGAVQAWPAGASCIDGSTQQSAADTVASFVATFNATATNGCQYSIGSDGSLSAGANCAVDPSLAGVSGSNRLVLLETANFVTVHSSILGIMSEADFASVLAHELGHYYRSHITARDSDYGYFYTLQPTEQPHKPTPEPALAALGQQAVVASTILDSSTQFLAVDGQKLRSDFYLLVGSLVTQAGNSSTASQECANAATLLTSSSYNKTMASFPFASSLTSAQKTAYKKYETAATACLATVPFTASSGQATAGTVTWASFKASMANPTWPSWLTRLTPEGQQQLQSIDQNLAARLDDNGPANATTLADAVAAASASFATVDSQAVAILDQVHAQHIGQYTIEQEADDESGEWIADLGFSPEVEVDAMRSLGKGMPPRLDGEVLGQDQCDVLWQQHWLDANGSYVYVPIGDFTDPHHSICYRMFNIERDAAVHHEVAANVPEPAHDGSDWTALQMQVTQLSEAAASNAAQPGSVVTKMVKHTGALDCAFSLTLRH